MIAEVPDLLLVGLALLEVQQLDAGQAGLASVVEVELADAALGEHRAFVIDKNEPCKIHSIKHPCPQSSGTDCALLKIDNKYSHIVISTCPRSIPSSSEGPLGSACLPSGLVGFAVLTVSRQLQ